MSAEIFAGSSNAELRAGEIEIEGEKHVVEIEPCTFMLEADPPIQVRVTKATKLGPPRELADAPWAELEEHPLVWGFEDPPGGHVPTELRGVIVSEGDRIWIAGGIDRSTSTDGYRGAGEVVVRAIEARWIGVGSGGLEWLEREVAKVAPPTPKATKPKPAAPTEPSLVGAQILAVLAVLGVFAGIALWTRVPYAPAIFAYAILFGSMALFAWRRRRFLPRMMPAFGTAALGVAEVQSERSSFRLLWGIGEAGAHTTIFAGLIMIAPAAMVAREDAMGKVFLFVVLLIAVLVQAGFSFRENRKYARLLDVIARAKPAEGDGWGAREGEVVDGRLSRWRTHTRQESTSTETYTDSDGRHQTREVTRRWYHGVEYGGGGTILVDVGGRQIRVPIETGALWATTRRSFRELRLDESIEPGDRVLLVCRIDGDRAKLGGAESVLLFADESDARGALERARLHHRIAMLGFVLAIAGCVLGFVL